MIATFLRVPVLNLEAADIRQVCDELVLATGNTPPHRYELGLWMWLSLFFSENPPKGITSQHCLPQGLLTTRIGKLKDSSLTCFLRELSQLHGLFFEGYANENVLSFLKRIGRVMNVKKKAKR
jgi:hypothetical protein